MIISEFDIYLFQGMDRCSRLLPGVHLSWLVSSRNLPRCPIQRECSFKTSVRIGNTHLTIYSSLPYLEEIIENLSSTDLLQICYYLILIIICFLSCLKNLNFRFKSRRYKELCQAMGAAKVLNADRPSGLAGSTSIYKKLSRK